MASEMDVGLSSGMNAPAPAPEIEVTPEMIEAAYHAVWDSTDKFRTDDGYRLDDDLFILIFRAMSKSREASPVCPPETQ